MIGIYRDISQTILRRKGLVVNGPAAALLVGILLWSLVAQPFPILLSTPNILTIAIVLALLLRLIFFDVTMSKLFKFATLILVPAVVLLGHWLFQIDPKLAEFIAQEDAVIEDASFGLLALGAVAMLIATWLLLLKRFWVAAGVSFLLGLGFVVLAGEEVSWFQRVLDIESSEFFLKNNMQKETNLHNLNSALFNRLFYLASFIFLAVIPFYRDQAQKLLTSLRLTSLEILLPPSWLALPFVLSFSFLHNTGMATPLFMVIIIASILILFKLWYESIRAKSWLKAAYISLATGLFALNVAYFLFNDFNSVGVRNLIGFEYMELFIAWGIFAYAAAVMLDVSTNINSQALKSAKH